MKHARLRWIVYGVTSAAWLGLCALVLRVCIDRAAAAKAVEEYGRAPSYQVLNFLFGYLPFLLVALAAVLALEWATFRAARWLRSRGGPRRLTDRRGRAARPTSPG